MTRDSALDGGTPALGTGAWTLGAALERAAAALGAAGIREPRREAVQLWGALTGTTAGQVWLARDSAPDGTLCARFEAAVARRAAGEPAAYVTGTASFRTLELEVTRATLIPRPETEGLVEHVLVFAGGRRPRAEALDVGTGSGCIALALATEGRFARIVATDVSEAALAVARRNHARLAPPVPVEFRRGPLFAPLAEGERFDVIVSNPPYITEGEHAVLDPAVREHEPAGALVAGADGMLHVRALLTGAERHLVPGGLLALEVDSRRAEAAHRAATEAGWRDVRVVRDLFGRPRYLLAIGNAR